MHKVIMNWIMAIRKKVIIEMPYKSAKHEGSSSADNSYSALNIIMG